MSMSWGKALLSPDGCYRYALWRDTGQLGAEGTVLFVMLNPSIADADTDDPTIRRCLGFARRWGYAHLAVGNLYAYRATNPGDLLDAAEAGVDPVGRENDDHLATLAANAWETIFAWGAHPMAGRRARDVRQLVEGHMGGLGNCLGQTKSLAPRHPLYVRGDHPRLPFKRYAEVSYD